MTKEKKTRRVLADMIAAELDIGGVFVSVMKDPLRGWEAKVMVAPGPAISVQTKVNQIAKALREKYDLLD